MSNTKFKPTVCLDFDGVMNTYDGWKGADELFTPRPHLKDFISTLLNLGYEFVVCSTRPAEKIKEWLAQWEIEGIREVVDKKPIASIYLDDRAICFDGNFDNQNLLDQIRTFKAHWEKSNA